MAKPSPPAPSRRAEYAEATRRAIIAAARELFAQRGYVGTKVDDIAERARVAVATVYAVAGGKQGLLHTLVDQWTEAPEVGEAYLAIDAAEDAVAVVSTVASLTRRMRRDWGDVMKIVLATAPLDEAAAENLRLGTDRYRAGLRAAAVRLADLDALKPGMTVDEATDLLWFFFGYASFSTLTEDNSWSPERSEQWLSELATRSLLKG
ncbi:TetR family transcriptional regulator [Mycobacterium sp. Dal123C01]|uniref:TetR family transcriptional regulator n=1 Tax=Mycobacterium sp. Dal123C01 TaxID=3457577 RepID=UPI00403EE005